MNDGDLYRVSWLGQAEAADFVGQAMGKIQSDLDDINSETQKLLAVWDNSDSQGAYLARQQKWTKAATDIIGALQKFQASLGTSADISSSTEKMNAATMTG